MRQHTFTYHNYSTKKINKVSLIGNFQFYKPQETTTYQSFKDNSLIPTYSVYLYSPDMFISGSTVDNKFLEYEMKETTKDTYEITLDLPDYTYSYDFKILYEDDTELVTYDPTNPPVVNPNSGHHCFHSLLDVNYPLKNTGTILFDSYKAIDETTQPLAIWLPKHYSKDKTYKTIYISHGGGGNEVEWMTIGHAPQIMSQFEENYIVVAMDHTYFKWDEKLVADNMVKAIIPYIEASYPVKKDRKSRIMCGLSMGSMMTNMLARNHPEVFGYFGAFSGGSSHLDTTLYKPEILNEAYYYLSVGCVDIAYNNDRGISTLDYLKCLDKLHVKYDYELLNGAHDWVVWQTSLQHFISKIENMD